MKNSDLISVVVPVYNVEKFLKKCVDSILNQSYKNLEIILVDDGSTDNSGKICDEYKQNDKRIKVIHKKNGGLSEARNFGIENSKGKYICFVDSDDFIVENMIDILHRTIKTDDSDLSVCRVIDCYGSIPKIKTDNETIIHMNSEEAIKKVMEAEEIIISAVAKLYKREIFSNNLKFEVGRTYEDAIIMIELLDKCQKISYNNSIVYYYIHRDNSITTKKFDPKKGYDIIYAYEKNYKIIENKYPKLIDIAKMRLCWANFHVLDNMARSSYKIDKKIVKYLRKNFFFIIKNQYFTKSRKLSMFGLMINTKIYVIIAKIFYKKRRKLVNNNG